MTMNVGLHHVVLFDLKPNTDLKKIDLLVDGCVRSVPGLIELFVGPNDKNIFEGKIDRSSGYNFVLVSRHIHADALKTYTRHPDHIKLAKFIAENSLRPTIAVDFLSKSSKL